MTRFTIQVGKPLKKSFARQVQEIAKGREGLVQREVEVHRGGKTFKQKRWVRPGEDVSQGKVAVNSAPEEKGGKKLQKLGIRGKPKEETEVKRGDNVSGVDVNGESVSGTVTGIGNDGVTIDHQYHIEHGKVKKDKKKPETTTGKPAAEKPETMKKIEKQGTAKQKAAGKQNAPPNKTYVDGAQFSAAEWSKQWVDPKATPDQNGFDYILDSFGNEGKEIIAKIQEVEAKLKGRPMTIQKYRLSGEGESARYTEEREKLHGRIMNELLSPDKLRVALPPQGEKPTFMMLGGRGGSGKSWFKNNVYDPSKFVVLDADEIKSKLPEFEGWNAQDVHEESTDILEQMITTCIRNGLNFVFDGTMKTATSALAKIFRMKTAGYRTEAHYMHLPAQEAAKRAIGRFKNGGEKGPNDEPPEPFSGRYVPVDVILKNTTNEDSFDQVKGLVDKWSFRDNNVEKRGEPPVVISEGEKSVKKSFADVVKNMILLYI